MAAATPAPRPQAALPQRCTTIAVANAAMADTERAASSVVPATRYARVTSQ
jgi:hypothetical protein